MDRVATLAGRAGALPGRQRPGRPLWWSALAAALLLGVSVACAPPPPGAAYTRLAARSTVTAGAPSGASPAQYYTLAAFRVADHLAAASNNLDDGLSDRAAGRITAAYLVVVADRSAQTVADAMAEADQLAPPPALRPQADHFYAAAAALATAVTMTRELLAAGGGDTEAQLVSVTQDRRSAAQNLESVMTSLVTVSWDQASPGS